MTLAGRPALSLFRTRTGLWYDPQDLTTMYQDAAGTLPVYRPGRGAVDPPVGLMLDKSQGLELGPELITNGTFDTDLSGWYTKLPTRCSLYLDSSGALVIDATAGDGGAPLASSPTMTGLFVVGKTYLVSWDSSSPDGALFTGNANFHDKAYSTTTPIGRTEFFIRATSTSGTLGIYGTALKTVMVDNVSIREIKGYHAYQTTTTARPALSGRYNLLTATETLSTQSVTTEATDYTLKFEGAGTITLSGTATGPISAGTHTITCTAGTLTCTVAGTVTRADLRVKRDGSSLPAYQAVTDANTYDTAGFPLYLKFDKIDDQLVCIVPTGGIHGFYAEGTIDGPVFGSVVIPAGSYAVPMAATYGPATCTQFIAIDMLPYSEGGE